MQVRGNYAYCAFRYGLAILDISDPAIPTYVGSCFADGEGKEVAVSGDYAYLADGVGGLKIFDITNPLSPVLAGAVDSAGYAEDVAVLDTFVYLACGESFYDNDNVIIVNASDPYNPYVTGHCYVSSEATGISVQGSYAYVTSDGGLSVINVANPRFPSRIALLSFGQDFPYGLTIRDSLAYLTSNFINLRIVSVADPHHPRLLGSRDLYDASWDVAVAGDYAYVASHYQGMTVVDISDPTSPDSVGGVDTGDLCWGIFLSGDYAYLADRNNGLAVATVSPTNPQIVGSYAPAWVPTGVGVYNDYAYVPDEWEHLWIVDISDPQDLAMVRRFDIENSFVDFDVEDSCIYAACGYWGFTVYDVSDPLNPEEIRHLGVQAEGVVAEGDYAYVSDPAQSEIRVYNISNPRYLYIMGILAMDEQRGKLSLQGHYLYVIAGSDIKAIDVANPAEPVLVGSYNTSSWPDDIGGSGNYVVFGTDSYIKVLSVSNPTDMKVTDSLETYIMLDDITVMGTTAFISWEHRPLLAFDFSNPRHIRILDNYGSSCLATCAASGRVYMIDPYGFQILAFALPDAISEDRAPTPTGLTLGNFPNPFNSSTVVEYSISKACDARLAVFDLVGRKILDFDLGRQRAGTYRRSLSMGSFSSGMYIYELQAGDMRVTRKMTLVK